MTIYTYRLPLVLFIASWLLSACSIRPYQGEGDILYTGIKRLEINQSNREVHTQRAIAAAEEQLSYAPNNAIFGSSSYRWPLPLIGPWFHLNYASDSTWIGRRIYRLLGSKPIWVRDVNPALRSTITERLLGEFGFLGARVTHEVHPYGQDSLRAKVSYQVDLGQVSRLDTVEYLPAFTLSDTTYLEHKQTSELHRGSIFSLDALQSDRQAIGTILREHGYYYFRPEHIRYEADTLGRNGGVHLRSKLIDGLSSESLKRWRIRRVNLRFLSGEEGAQSLLLDTLELAPKVMAYYHQKMPLRAKALYARLRLLPDSLFQQSKADLTLQSLSKTGALSGIEMLYEPVEVVDESLHTEREIDLSIIMRQDKLWEVSLETYFKTKSTEFLGPGLSLSLDRRNLFGGGETLSASFFGSYEWQTGRSPFTGLSSALNSYHLGAELALTFPALLIPGKLDARYDFPTSTTFKLSGQLMNRARFYGLGSFGLSSSYHFTPKSGHTHSITPLSIGYNQLRYITDSFRQILLDNPSLILSMQDQLIPQIGYTYTWEQAVGKDEAHHLWIKAGLSEAGNLTNALLALARQGYSTTKKILGVPYAQFVKGTGELRYTYHIDRNQKLASRLSLGAIYPYGNVRYAPYMEQFYIGGANSIRAFTVRSLGPGRYRPNEESIYTFIDRVGETKLEMNLEYRGRLMGNLEGAVFVDAGNVWLLRQDRDKPGGALGEIKGLSDWLNQIAVGTGVGLRYDLSYLVVRCDLGIGLHLPYTTNRSGWYNIPHFSDALGLHIAIGYPF